MRRAISLIFFIPGHILMWLTELVRGEKVVSWRSIEIAEAMVENIETRCTKCGNVGKLKIPTKDKMSYGFKYKKDL